MVGAQRLDGVLIEVDTVQALIDGGELVWEVTSQDSVK